MKFEKDTMTKEELDFLLIQNKEPLQSALKNNDGLSKQLEEMFISFREWVEADGTKGK